MIRKATEADIESILRLLHQVNMVHHDLRPDLFKPNTTKYNANQLRNILSDPFRFIFISEESDILGYAFVEIEDTTNDILLHDKRTLYIDDICVDEQSRGKHVGSQLFAYVVNFANSIGCNNITLNVWEGNDAAMAFYRQCGMFVRKTCMELTL